jgi:hypothetical protein
MGAFKKYREEKTSKKLPAMETTFGKHSLPKTPKKLPAMETTFGKHSLEKPQLVKEDADAYQLSHADQQTIHKNFAPLNDDINKSQKQAAEKYSTHSQDLNSTLHDLYNSKPKVAIHNIHEHVDQAHLIGAMLDNHKTKAPIHVYTGVKHSPVTHFQGDNEHSEHATVHLPAFTSTSTSLQVAKGFAGKTTHPDDHKHGVDSAPGNGANHILRIHVPEGSHAASIRHVALLQEENEVLLHRGHNLEIHKTPEKIGSSTYLWHAKLVSHKPENISADNE